MKRVMSLALVGVLSLTFQAGSLFAATTTEDMGVSQLSVTSTTASRGDTIVNKALAWKGVKYKYGGNSRSGIDCTFFVNTIYKEAGLPYTHMSATTWAKNPNNPPKQLVKVNTPQKGDIVIFAPGAGCSHGHAGIYIDSKKFIGSQSSTGVSYANYGSYWGKSRKIVGYYRYK